MAEDARQIKMSEIDYSPFLTDGEPLLTFVDFENSLNVYQDKNDFYFYNLNSTIYLDVPNSRLKKFICQHDLHWPIISYKIYGTVRLAWLLMKINHIMPKLAFEIVPAGSIVSYLDRGDLTTVLDNF